MPGPVSMRFPRSPTAALGRAQLLGMRLPPWLNVSTLLAGCTLLLIVYVMSGGGAASGGSRLLAGMSGGGGGAPVVLDKWDRLLEEVLAGDAKAAQECSADYKAAVLANVTAGLRGPPMLEWGCELEQVGPHGSCTGQMG